MTRLIAFVIEAASTERFSKPEEEQDTAFEDAASFDDWIDESHGSVSILEGVFQPSQILYTSDRQQYESALAGWQPEE